ncbi:MAG TPA: VOC family protein [Caulobacteraceae bacterium]|nr:VOC family protein [Caulobacteraceae bacterium]
MEQRMSVITLGVKDLDLSRRFYVEGLRWAPVMEVEGEVVFFNVGPGLVVGLYSGLAADAGVQPRGPGLTAISQNVREKAEVDALMAEALAAGAVVTQPARDTDWGGRCGYFSDPDGHLWEVAWNPFWPIDEAGRVQINRS